MASETFAPDTELVSTTESTTEDDPKPVLSLENVSKQFGVQSAVSDLSLTVYENELLTLLGPSGCGKTTTLRLMAGLERPSAGKVRLGGSIVAGGSTFKEPEDRGVGIVFQDFALFPHLSVGENIEFGLTEMGPQKKQERVTELLDLVGLSGYEDRNPDQLSGGERQRVALARSLAPEPEILLLDEPFSNLDVRLRVEMREEVRRILKNAGVTTVSVTHDQEEALSLSDRVAVMQDGQVEQIGRPEAVFEHPESRFVASFLGKASFLSGQINDGRLQTPIGTYSTDILKGLTDDYDGATVDVLVRPDDLRAELDSEENNGQIIHRQYNGPSFVYRVELSNSDVVHCEHNHSEDITLDEPVRVELDADHSLAWYPSQ